jgi:hypothetical protein
MGQSPLQAAERVLYLHDAERRAFTLPMADPIRTPADHDSEVLDVELLDVFAQIEALLRCGREVQREALRVRGVPVAVSVTERLAAGRAIRAYLNDMAGQCAALIDVIAELQETARQLEKRLVSEATPS